MARAIATSALAFSRRASSIRQTISTGLDLLAASRKGAHRLGVFANASERCLAMSGDVWRCLLLANFKSPSSASASRWKSSHQFEMDGILKQDTFALAYWRLCVDDGSNTGRLVWRRRGPSSWVVCGTSFQRWKGPSARGTNVIRFSEFGPTHDWKSLSRGGNSIVSNCSMRFSPF